MMTSELKEENQKIYMNVRNFNNFKNKFMRYVNRRKHYRYKR